MKQQEIRRPSSIRVPGSWQPHLGLWQKPEPAEGPRIGWLGTQYRRSVVKGGSR